MKFKTAYGSEKKLKNAHKYRINWNADSRSKIQKRVKNILRPYWENDIVFEELPVVGSKLSLDFYNATKDIVIEVQGRQHFEYVKYFHGKNRLGYLKQLARDENKFKFCEINDFELIEVREGFEEDFDELEKMLNGI